MTEKSFSNSQEAYAQVKENYLRICENIEKAAEKAKTSDKIRLMAVTKTVPYEKVNYAASLGIDLLGENRVQEFLEKKDFYLPKCEVHFIGGLQSNKVKYIIDKVSMIHSVDSEKLACEISKRACANGTVMDILIEINIGREESKGGIMPEAANEFSDYCSHLDGIRLRGFMAIPPVDVNGSSERYFEQMQRIFSDCHSKYSGMDTLSMGMSNDYEQAILHGSNLVRIGSALFGSRK